MQFGSPKWLGAEVGFYAINQALFKQERLYFYLGV